MQKSTLRNFVLHGPIITKFDTINYFGDPYSDANFSSIWFGGELFLLECDFL